MRMLRHILPVFLIAFLSATVVSIDAYGQAVGADDYEAPDDDSLPGDATAPPTEQPDQAAIHVPDEQAAQQAPQPDLSDGDRRATIRVSHGTGADADLGGLAVRLSAVRPPGPLQPDSFQQVLSTWEAETDADGVAHFDDLPDDLERQQLSLMASAEYDGIWFDSDLVTPGENIDLSLNVYERTDQFPGIRITQKRVLVSSWEEYLIFDQFWTIEIEGDRAFNTKDSTDPALRRGLPLRLPYRAEGISFAGPDEHQIIDNVIFWDGVLQPNKPLTLQIRFSKSVRTSGFTFEQPMQYPVDDLQILASVDTDSERIPRLDDLTLRAPGFEVGTDPGAAGLPPHTTRDFIVATDHSVDRGESYTFRIDGLPFSRPIGGWLSLFGGILAAFFIALYGRREYTRLKQSNNRDEVLEALHRRREEVLDELAEIEYELDDVEYDDELFDLEQEQTLLRQRLALILRKIADLESQGSSPSEAA